MSVSDCGGDSRERSGRHSLLIRRNTATGELAFYRCWTPCPATLAQLVRVTGVRWIVEESFQAAKDPVGLDQHQVRRWTSWHRFTTPALAALAICAADARAPDRHGQPDMIELTVNEIRRLFNVLLIRPTRSIAYRSHWSNWRRRHQAHARHARRFNPRDHGWISRLRRWA
jgi:hypothetical protein